MTRPHPARSTLLTAGTLLVAAVTGCAAPTSGPEDAADAEGPLAGPLTVFAAASLTEVFEDLGARFEQANPDVDLRFSFSGSADLVSQVSAGAPADVLATADLRTMDQAEQAGVLAGPPVPFATNHLVLVTPPDDPGGVTGLDESLEGATLVTCAPQVPCGAAAVELAEVAGVELDPVSEESAVTDVLGKVLSGQADAGLVYASDAARAGAAVRTLPVPDAESVTTTYPAAVLTDAQNAAAATAWVTWLTAAEASTALQQAGFGAP